MSTRTPGGRRVVTRAQAAEMLGISVSHLDRLYADRDTSGFPERADDGRSWFADDIASYRLPRDRAREDTRAAVDRSGNPDELVDTEAAARILGYKSRRSLTGQNRLWPLLLSHVDEEQPLTGGRTQRRWKRRTIWDLADSRTGKGAAHTGRPTGTARGRPDRSGDPDELVAAPEAARVLGYNRAQALPDHVLARADTESVGVRGRRRRQWKRQTLWAILDEALPLRPTN
ncbi:hypothetical protein KBX50_29015 [Micromonospora sp. C51]|uniref:hypothetical protein n=1 Tax=Micromonospora sp. C51 TaxID=2824879 RepID=UPI001B374C1D|nr:hypothetical protein [Micromonospora sp. C51]MBQ1052479.1 hypothetical protein [Micromonospora sp. C51]